MLTETIDGLPLDLFVDLQSADDTGLAWGLLADAPQPDRVIPGAWIIAGSPETYAVCRVVDVADGVVHVRPQDGPARNWLDRIESQTAQT